MRLRLIAVGSRMPKWVEEGWHEYAKRMPSELALELVARHPLIVDNRSKATRP